MYDPDIERTRVVTVKLKIILKMQFMYFIDLIS